MIVGIKKYLIKLAVFNSIDDKDKWGQISGSKGDAGNNERYKDYCYRILL